MNLYYILILFLLVSCSNTSSNNKANQDHESDQNQITTDKLTENYSDTTDNSSVIDTSFSDEGTAQQNINLSNYLSPDELSKVKAALKFYAELKTDSDMAVFYFSYLPTALDKINKAFHKYLESSDEETEWQFVEDWNAEIAEDIPFMIFIIDNHFDGAESYQYNSALLEKAELTSGKADDAFFESEILCWGMYPAAYSGLHNEQIACDIGTSTYGGGLHYRALKSVIKANAISKLFKVELDKSAEYIVSEEEIISFGYSRKEAEAEIEQILNLKDSTSYDLSKVEKLKLFMNSTSRKLYFNCLDGNCPP